MRGERDIFIPTDEQYATRLKLTAVEGITLNGEPARVTGVNKRFATVTQRKSGLSAEWSWEAVERVIAKGGAFKS